MEIYEHRVYYLRGIHQTLNVKIIAVFIDCLDCQHSSKHELVLSVSAILTPPQTLKTHQNTLVEKGVHT